MVFFGNFDIAQLVLYAFWIFLFALIVYLQRESMREGYPLESETGGQPGSLFGMPKPKTFKLPNGRGTRTVPDGRADKRPIAAKRAFDHVGAPLVPTGNPLVDGVGPAAWAERADVPDLAHDGSPRITPMRSVPEFSVFGHRKDPRGFPVVAGDGAVVGRVKDLWIDKSEQLIRYIEIDLGEAGTRLAPITMCRISDRRAYIGSIFAKHFPDVPQPAKPDQITMLEEEKVSAYYCGGTLYASPERQEPLL
jgi:photosynthetic reaction center H subunit